MENKTNETLKNILKINSEKQGTCIVWTGGTEFHGYGRIRYEGIRDLTHRISYRIHKGNIPPKMLVCHKCDNPPCINPDHLFLGTIQDNMRDKFLKGRCPVGDANGARKHPERIKKGSEHYRAKLSESDVRNIRKYFSSGKLNGSELAKLYKVHQSSISYIVTRKNWKHIE